jgi:transcriptional regulator with XRE-family HTH domain
MNETLKQNSKTIGKRIGTLLRQIRLERGLSLESLACNIGISKLTLGQIERGDANPTLSMIWKIANGLSVPLTSLLVQENEVSIVRQENSIRLISSNENFIVEPLFTIPKPHSFELYRGCLKPKSQYVSEAHSPGVIEFVTVMSGELTVQVDNNTYKLNSYDSIRFYADTKHIYINNSSEMVVLHFVILYTSGDVGSILFKS